MKFHWKAFDNADKKLTKFYIELEYKLRPIITLFLLARLEKECNGDFTSFHFDIDLEAPEINISDQTPIRFKRLIANDFKSEIQPFFLSIQRPNIQTRNESRSGLYPRTG